PRAWRLASRQASRLPRRWSSPEALRAEQTAAVSDAELRPEERMPRRETQAKTGSASESPCTLMHHFLSWLAFIVIPHQWSRVRVTPSSACVVRASCYPPHHAGVSHRRPESKSR